MMVKKLIQLRAYDMPNGLTYIGQYIYAEKDYGPGWAEYFRHVTVHRSSEIYSDFETKGTLKQVLKQYHEAKKKTGKVFKRPKRFDLDACLSMYVLETYRDDCRR